LEFRENSLADWAEEFMQFSGKKFSQRLDKIKYFISNNLNEIFRAKESKIRNKMAGKSPTRAP
jgi:hypothetical protein